MKLTLKQTKALDLLEDSETTEVLYGGSAGGGKSALGCYWILKQCFKYPGTRWMMGRSELKNLKKTTLNTFFEIAKLQGLTADRHYKFNQQDSTVKLINGSEVLLADLFAYPSDPNFDSLGSLEITGAFIDECSQVTEKAKNIVKSRIRYKLNEYNLLGKMLMTCNPCKDWPYREFYKPMLSGEIDKGKVFIQALPTDNPHLPAVYIENLKSLDVNSRERLLYGNWEYDDDPSSLIQYDKIIDCFSNSLYLVVNLLLLLTLPVLEVILQLWAYGQGIKWLYTGTKGCRFHGWRKLFAECNKLTMSLIRERLQTKME